MPKWIYVNVWPNDSPYADGGWNAIYGPFDTKEEMEKFCNEHRLNVQWGQPLTDPSRYEHD